MDLSEKMVSSQTIFEGKIIKVTLDQARLPDGTLAGREVVYHPGGVAVLALDEDNTVYLVNQYRYPIQQLLLELPAGKLDHGAEEDRLLGAQRELSEEIGASAGRWDALGHIMPSVGYTDEMLYLYLARDLSFGHRHLDEGEFLEPFKLPFAEVLAMAEDGRINDAKTVAALFRADRLIRAEAAGRTGPAV